MAGARIGIRAAVAAAVMTAVAAPAWAQASPKAPAAASAVAPAAKAPAAAPVPAPKVPVKTGSLEVKVTVPDGVTLTSGTIQAKTQQAPLVAAGVAVKLSGVPAGRVAVIVEAQAGPKRYLGAAETSVQADGLQKATVSVVPVDNVETFCLGCHPSPNDPNVKPAPGAIVRDLHTSGREFPEKTRERYLAQVRKHNERVVALEREGKPHHLPIVLDERTEMVAGKEVKRSFYTCESCHTLHQATPGGTYARAPFRDKSILCRGCHF